MILNLLYKPHRYRPLVEVRRLTVSTNGISGAIPSLPLRQVLIVPRATLDEFRLSPGELRENLVIDDSRIGPLHTLSSGTVLKIGGVLIRLTVHCEPCGRLRSVVDIKAVEHRRGYLGTFLTPGELEVGSAITSIGIQYESIPYDLKERVIWFLTRQTAPVEVTRLVHEVGLSLSYCRAIPNLLRGRPDLAAKVTFRGRTLRKGPGTHGAGGGAACQGEVADNTMFEDPDTFAESLEFIAGAFVVYLRGERSFTVPLESIPRLMKATTAEQSCWEIADRGRRIRWPHLGLEVTTAALLGLPD